MGHRSSCLSLWSISWLNFHCGATVSAGALDAAGRGTRSPHLTGSHFLCSSRGSYQQLYGSTELTECAQKAPRRGVVVLLMSSFHIQTDESAFILSCTCCITYKCFLRKKENHEPPLPQNSPQNCWWGKGNIIFDWSVNCIKLNEGQWNENS